MRQLVIAAFWTDEAPDVATDRVSGSLTDGVKGSGAVVAIGQDKVDRDLRRWLRRVNIAEAADHVAPALKPKDETHG
jgi:hypothetical protein